MILREEASDRMFKMSARSAPMPAAASLQEVVVTGAKKVQQEQLGDLKLYRVPERTTLASRQSKQVRLMDQPGIPVNYDLWRGLRDGQPWNRIHGPGTSLAAHQEHRRKSFGTAIAVGLGRGVRLVPR